MAQRAQGCRCRIEKPALAPQSTITSQRKAKHVETIDAISQYSERPEESESAMTSMEEQYLQQLATCSTHQLVSLAAASRTARQHCISRSQKGSSESSTKRQKYGPFCVVHSSRSRSKEPLSECHAPTLSASPEA